MSVRSGLISIAVTLVVLTAAIAILLYVVPVDRDEPPNLVGHAVIVGLLAMIASRVGDSIAAQFDRH